jgi:hypothetical protein
MASLGFASLPEELQAVRVVARVAAERARLALTRLCFMESIGFPFSGSTELDCTLVDFVARGFHEDVCRKESFREF